jgi:hypothetical protein
VRNEDEDGVEEVKQQEEFAAGDINPSEYDYLLTMPLWSLSEEKIEELNKQMNNKKDDHDNLEATHIFKLWERDLEEFLVALSKQEDKDERDRLAHKGIVNNGKLGGKRKLNKPIPKAKPAKGEHEIEDEAFAPSIKSHKTKGELKPKKGKTSKTPAKKKKVQSSNEKSPPEQQPVKELSLRERLAMKANLDYDKMEITASNPLYDTMGMGNSMTLNAITSLIGRKKQKDESESDGFQGSPTQIPNRRVNAPTRRRRVIDVDEDDSSEFDDEEMS